MEERFLAKRKRQRALLVDACRLIIRARTEWRDSELAFSVPFMTMTNGSFDDSSSLASLRVSRVVRATLLTAGRVPDSFSDLSVIRFLSFTLSSSASFHFFRVAFFAIAIE